MSRFLKIIRILFTLTLGAIGILIIIMLYDPSTDNQGAFGFVVLLMSIVFSLKMLYFLKRKHWL